MDSTDFHAGAARGGDQESLAVLYERLAPALFAWAKLRLPQARAGTGPDDLLQEVWLRAMESFSRFESRGRGSFRAWIFKIASHVYIGIMRRRSSREGPSASEPLSQVPAEVTSITAGLRKSETIERLVREINGLEALDRALFIHRGLEGMTAALAGEILGLSTEAVHKRWQRLRERLEVVPAFVELVEDDTSS